MLSADAFFMRFHQFLFNFGSYFWLFLILTPLALAAKFAHLTSAELFLKVNWHRSSICCHWINLFVKINFKEFGQIFAKKSTEILHDFTSHQKYSNNKKCCSFNNWHKILSFKRSNSFYEKFSNFNNSSSHIKKAYTFSILVTVFAQITNLRMQTYSILQSLCGLKVSMF